MPSFDVKIPDTRGKFRPFQNADEVFGEFDQWFRDNGVCVHRLSPSEIPLVGIKAAYHVSRKADHFRLTVYVEDSRLAVLAKLRWGGGLV
jgi:hypothetical protein